MKNESLLKLFKGYEGNKRAKKLNEEALKYGVIIPINAPQDVVDTAIELYGVNGFLLNQTFHKDFYKVATTDIETLLMEQLIHYFTTYGCEMLFGEYDSNMVFIPAEALDIPELKNDIKFAIIKPMNQKEIKKSIYNLINSGIALSKDTVNSIITLSDYIEEEDIDSIKNKEVKIALYEKFDIVPSDAEDFLRYLLYKTTGLTLKIKDSRTISSLKMADINEVKKLLKKYISKNSINSLASIFFRNKELFLALKGDKEVNKIINKIRKLANIYHKPIKASILDNLAYTNAPKEKIIEKLDSITIYKEIRILNGLLYQLEGASSIVYKIRNGKSYAKKLSNKNREQYKALSNKIDILRNHLINRLSQKVKDKTIYIPENVVYAAPSSEKQFNGNFPSGSYIELPRTADLIYGIHWENLKDQRVDLDLHQMNKSEVFGWDGNYRDESRNILFSGDVTDAPAPKGATELFYVSRFYGVGAFLVSLNNYTKGDTVSFKFMVAESDVEQSKFCKNYVVNPNNILTTINMEVEKDNYQKVIGFIVINSDNIRFYFNDYSNGAARSSRMNEVQTMSFEYLNSYSKVQVKLNDLLKEAGAIIVTEKTEDSINLSPEAINKETIINLLAEKKD